VIKSKQIFSLFTTLLAGSIFLLSCGGSKVSQTSIPTVEQRFELGKTAYDKEDWLEAIRIFDEIRLQAPTSSVATEATFLEGMARYKAGTYISAAVDFRSVRRNYPSSLIAPRAQFMVGESYYMLSPQPLLDQQYSGYALIEYQNFLRDYSSTEKNLSDSAQMRIGEIRNKLGTKYLMGAELYLKLSYYKAAIQGFNRVVDSYYDTPAAIEAQLRIAEVQYGRKKFRDAQDAIQIFEDKFFKDATPSQRNRAHSIKQSVSMN
jgi:outer membrane assembly lipoprotein YfiO